MPLPLSTKVPEPLLMVKPIAVKLLSTSVALASNCAWVIKRTPLSSAMAAKVTGLVTGVSLTGLMVTEAVPPTVNEPSVIV